MAAVSIVGGGTLVTFDTLPAAADWSTASFAGAAGDITTAAALDAGVALLLSSGITSQLGNPGVSPPAAAGLGQFNSIALNIQTRPTGVKFNEVMATLQNNTGSAVSSLAISYNFGVNAPLAESAGLWGHRVYFSLTGAASSWTNIAAFNLADNAPAAVLNGSISLGNWANGATLFVLWADDNGPNSPDTGFTLDNVSLTPTLAGRNLVYNRAHGVGGAPNGAFTTAGGNYWLDGAAPAAFAAADAVTFSQDGTATIDVPAPGVTAAGMTVSHASGTYTIGGAGAITSVFTKTNAGALVLTSANAFSARAISGGSVETRASGALGTTGVLTLSGGGILQTTTVAQTLGGQISIGTGGGTVQTDTDLGATGLDGAGALTKSGGGTLSLTGASGTASGGLIIQAGKVSVATDAVLGGNTQTFTLNGGTLEFTNPAAVTFIDATKTRTVNVGVSGGTIAVTDTVQANGVVIALADRLVGAAGTTLTKAGAGTLRISATQSTLNSNWIVSDGALESAVAGTAGSLGSGSVTLNSGGIVVVPGGGAQTNTNAIILAGGAIGTRSGDLAVYGGTVNVTAASNVNLKSNTTQPNSQSITVSGKVSGSASLTLNGNNAGGNGGNSGGGKFLALTNTTNDYSGTFNVLNAQILRSAPATTGNTLGTSTLNLTGGTLQVRDDGAGSAGTIAYGNNVIVGTNGGTVDVDRVGTTNTGNTVALGTLSIGAQTLTTAGANGYGVSFGATTLTGDATFNPTTAATTLGGGVSGGFGLTMSGAGTLTISGAQSYSALTTSAGTTTLTTSLPGATITNTAGILNLNANATNSAVTANATTNFGSAQKLASLGIGATGVATLAAHTGGPANIKPIDTAGLAITAGGKLDLTNNVLVVRGGSLAAITTALGTGYATGTWAGPGINSSTAAGDASFVTALGVIDNSVTLLSTFGGVTGLTGAEILVKYTYYGDANLDGQVTGADYSQIDNGFANGLTGWFNGDFNYDGVVTGADYSLIDNAFANQTAQLRPDGAAGAPLAVVPEAGSIALLTAGALGLAARRRRKA